MKRFVVILVVGLGVSVIFNVWLLTMVGDYSDLTNEQVFLIKEMKRRTFVLETVLKELLKRRKDDMQDSMLLNGKPRCTLIQRFNGDVVIVEPVTGEAIVFRDEIIPLMPIREKMVFDGKTALEDALKKVESKGWVVGWSHPTIRKDRKEA